MHDLHEANKIVKLIIQYAVQNKLHRVTKAVIELGQLEEHGAEILPANLIFNIQLLAKGTVAENLQVKVSKIKGATWNLTEIEGE